MNKENITKKFRPKTFSAIVGQPIAVKTVQAALSSGTLPPAYLFYGIQGSGKTTMARLIAMSTNCTSKTGIEPCSQCPACKDILNECSDCLIEYDGATHSGVADLRDIMASVRYVVPDGQYKVVIIDECQALSKSAWQAALKTIEEPPKNVMFIFCTTEIQKVLATIKSRSVRLQFAGVDDAVLVSMLKNILASEQVKYEDKAVDVIAKHANGSIRDAQSILEGFIRTGDVSAKMVKGVYQTLDPMSVFNFFNYVLNKSTKQAAAVAHGWLKLGSDPEVIISGLMEHMRAMVMDFTIDDENLKKILKGQREKIGESRISAWIELFYDQLRFLRDHPMTHWLLIDLLTIRLINACSEESPKKARKTKENKDIDIPSVPQPPTPEEKLDTSVVAQLEAACKGRSISVDQNLQRVTIQNHAGTVFDIVTKAEYAVSPFYILKDDLKEAVSTYPAGMQKLIKAKS